MEETQTAATIDSRRFRKRDILITIAALVITIALCAAFIIYWGDISRAQNYGYLGVFIINIFAGAVVVVPVPGILVVFALGGSRVWEKQHSGDTGKPDGCNGTAADHGSLLVR